MNKVNPEEEKLLVKVDTILNGVASPVEQQGVSCVNLVAQIERLLLGERTRKIPLLTPDISVK